MEQQWPPQSAQAWDYERHEFLNACQRGFSSDEEEIVKKITVNLQIQKSRNRIRLSYIFLNGV